VGTGLTIAAYTTVDGVGVRLSASPVGYIGWLMVLESLCVPMFALARRRDVLLKQPKRILLAGLAAGALSVLAYGLVLWAQTRGALAPIAALRETSVIFGAIIATLIFREPFGPTQRYGVNADMDRKIAMYVSVSSHSGFSRPARHPD
jgi:drug/metabolite transporter (DMT)-like permease